MKRILPALAVGAIALAACGGASATPPQTKVVYKTPAACTEALDLSDQVILEASQALGQIGDALTSLGAGDSTLLLALPDKLDAATQRVSVLKPKYDAARSACEGQP